MSNKQILEKAIEKAWDQEWRPIDHIGAGAWKLKTPAIPELMWRWPWILFRSFDNDGGEVEVNIEHIIFDHDFAKALWGEDDDVHHLDREYVNPGIGGHYDEHEQVPMQLWQLNLMQMVIADDPIKYLKEHM